MPGSSAETTTSAPVDAGVGGGEQRVGRHVQADVLHGDQRARAGEGRAERHLQGHLLVGRPLGRARRARRTLRGFRWRACRGSRCPARRRRRAPPAPPLRRRSTKSVRIRSVACRVGQGRLRDDFSMGPGREAGTAGFARQHNVNVVAWSLDILWIGLGLLQKKLAATHPRRPCLPRQCGAGPRPAAASQAASLPRGMNRTHTVGDSEEGSLNPSIPL